MPSSIGILITFLSIGILLYLARPNKYTRMLILAALTCFSLVYWTPLAAWLIWPLETAFPAYSAQSGAQNSIIVHLSGAERPERVESSSVVMLNDQHGRYFEVMRLLTALPEATVLFAGGYRKENVSDGDIAIEAYRRAGLDKRLTVIGNARNTFENGRDVAAYLAENTISHPIILVSSAAHMPRAVLSFQAHQIAVVPAPALALAPKMSFWQSWSAYGARIENLELFQRAMHEWGGLIVYRLTGRTQHLWPG